MQLSSIHNLTLALQLQILIIVVIRLTGAIWTNFKGKGRSPVKYKYDFMINDGFSETSIVWTTSNR